MLGSSVRGNLSPLPHLKQTSEDETIVSRHIFFHLVHLLLKMTRFLTKLSLFYSLPVIFGTTFPLKAPKWKISTSLGIVFLFRALSAIACVVGVDQHERSRCEADKEEAIQCCWRSVGIQARLRPCTASRLPIESVLPIFTRVFQRKTSIKTAVFVRLFHFLSARLCWDIPGAPWQGRMWRFPFQTGALVSITSPGVSPKIHTFCQSSGIESGWRRRRGVAGEEEVFQATGGPFPGGRQAGRLRLRSTSALAELK